MECEIILCGVIDVGLFVDGLGLVDPTDQHHEEEKGKRNNKLEDITDTSSLVEQPILVEKGR